LTTYPLLVIKHTFPITFRDAQAHCCNSHEMTPARVFSTIKRDTATAPERFMCLIRTVQITIYLQKSGIILCQSSSLTFCKEPPSYRGNLKHTILQLKTP